VDLDFDEFTGFCAFITHIVDNLAATEIMHVAGTVLVNLLLS